MANKVNVYVPLNDSERELKFFKSSLFLDFIAVLHAYQLLLLLADASPLPSQKLPPNCAFRLGVLVNDL